MSPKEYVEAMVGKVKVADLGRKVREAAREFPIWSQLAQKAQEGSKDADLMTRLSY